MFCENNYYCKCEKCDENKNNIVCPFCGAKLRSIEECIVCRKSLALRNMTLGDLGKIGVKTFFLKKEFLSKKTYSHI